MVRTDMSGMEAGKTSARISGKAIRRLTNPSGGRTGKRAAVEESTRAKTKASRGRQGRSTDQTPEVRGSSGEPRPAAMRVRTRAPAAVPARNSMTAFRAGAVTDPWAATAPARTAQKDRTPASNETRTLVTVTGEIGRAHV